MLRAKLSQSSAITLVYERAHEGCRMIYDRLPSPKQIQTLVQVWKWR